MLKIALITGATAGIGEACAKIFAAQNYNLILAARRQDRLDKLAKELIDAYGIKVHTVVLDVRDKQAVAEKLGWLPDEWKKVDVLINNAGLSLGLDPINTGDTNDWDTMIDTNVKGLLYVTKTVSAWMVENRSGHIINIGSIAAKEVYPNGNVYCASKHAVDALNQAMRIDLLPFGIRVTAIHPGPAETEFSEVRFKGDKERAKKVYNGYQPLVAVDIAETIWFAVSRPAHVNISDLLIMPAAQATATIVNRN
ncbi:MAG: SDR family NAD(P)-dependent oxidoreductase [Sphingobacteriaceae bacterium]|nr:MAG: SDR family NAD(P)-dependent oxidoreductase [Sphingobacteriaceae bacterium]